MKKKGNRDWGEKLYTAKYETCPAREGETGKGGVRKTRILKEKSRALGRKKREIFQ